jgi:hypothetical protein
VKENKFNKALHKVYIVIGNKEEEDIKNIWYIQNINDRIYLNTGEYI